MLLMILIGVLVIVIAFLILIAINTAVAIYVMSHMTDDENETERMESRIKGNDDNRRG